MTLAVAAVIFLVFELTSTKLPSIGTAALVVGTICFFYMLASAKVRAGIATMAKAIATMAKAVAGALVDLRRVAGRRFADARSRREEARVVRAGPPSTDLPKQGDRPVRIRFFTARYDWMGPVIIVLSSWYFAAQVLVAWVFRPGYSFVSNVISDLGNTGCPPAGSNICSPRWVVMDASIALLGLAMIVGSVLIFTEFSFSSERRERGAAIAGFVCLALGGVGAILVGSVPENVNTAHLHTVGTAMAIGFGQLAILILGLVLRQIPDWLREFMLVTSLFVLLASIPIAFKHQFGIGEGALERLAQYPESLWLILFGFYISRNHYRINVTGPRFRFRGNLPAQQSTLRWALGKSGQGARRTAPAPAQASAYSAGEHAVTGVNPPESPAQGSLLAEQRTLILNQRFATAAGQLGSESSAVRLAGVYAMAGLADDWPENRQTCVDVLCAYLRMPTEHDPGDEASEPERLTFQANREIRHTVIRVITAHLKNGAAVSWQDLDLDFTGVVFDGGSFRGAKFSGGKVSFGDAKFSGGEVDFVGAEFSGGEVDFVGAKFSGGRIRLDGAEFSGGTVSFRRAKFSAGEVRFSDAKFSGGKVSFRRAEFSGGEVNFRLAWFSGSEVDFSDVRFCGGTVSFRGARFSHGQVYFSGAEFSGGAVGFGSAKFSGCEVNFYRARFSGGVVGFLDARFSGGQIGFDNAEFSGSEVGFSLARFSGGTVSFRHAEFSGGEVDFSSASDWSMPPEFPWTETPPPAVKLPKREDQSQT
jgi:uncharacterized protein YjbI with pentapeptide repeats/hypothetical membrane protein